MPFMRWRSTSTARPSCRPCGPIRAQSTQPHIAEPNAAMAPISDSYAQMAGGLYRLLTLGMRYYRRIGLPPESEGPGVSNINETIDSSVFDRWRADKTYRPPGLAAWANMKNVDPDK